MISEKFSLTLFDILSYLLPGFVVLFTLSLLEATFLANSSLLSLTALGNNLFLFSILSYYLGHVCHIVATTIKDTFFQNFKPASESKKDSLLTMKLKKAIYHHMNRNEHRLSQPLYNRLRQLVQETYHIPLGEGEKLTTLDNYLLADSYIVASGCEGERNSLMVREGFFKSSTIAFVILALTIWGSLFMGGLHIQIEAGQAQSLGSGTTIFLAVIVTILSLLFKGRFNYYNRMKLNNSYLLFLSYREKEKFGKVE